MGHDPVSLTTRPRKRAARGSITRQQVIDAALAIIERGVSDVSIRGLARDLGVAPMTIYRHVRDRDDLLEEVVDRLLAERWRPPREDLDWTRWVLIAADRLRELLVSYPIALQVYLRHPVTTPSAVERMEAMLWALRHGFIKETVARRAYAAVHTYTLGFAALQASRNAVTDHTTTGLARELSSFTTPAQFREGLRYLLSGFRSLN